MKSGSFTVGLLAVLLCGVPSHAQVTADVAKISCKQFLIGKIAPTKSIAIWLIGYYNGKRNNTVIDFGTVEANTEKVKDYCRMNLEMTIMDAVQTALGLDK